MRILVLATRYFGPGGAEAYTRLVTQALTEDGADVEALSLLGGDLQDGFAPQRYVGFRDEHSNVWTRARFFVEALRRGRRKDLLVCSHTATAPVGMLLHRLFGTPYLVIAHGIEVWGDVGPRRQTALRRAARIMSVSHFTARMLATVQGVPLERISVVHPCVDPALFTLAGSPAEPAGPGPITLLTVARLSAQERYKGCDTVIQALPAVAARAGPVRYAIIGDGDDRPRLEALAQDRGVDAAVAFAGSVGRCDLAARYRACDIFVMPSVTERRPGGWAGEGFGIVYLEAATFGRPVVAGAGGGAPEAIQDGVTGFTVDGRDVEAVADVLVRLARDGELRTRMGEAGRQWVRERFTFGRFRREVGGVVQAAVGAARSARRAR